jgi:hypothetical protein
MRKYLGTKEANATPMSWRTYNDFRGWELPESDDGADEGYMVGYENRISWSPKDVFERTYRVADTPLDRMRIEHDDLLDRYNKLVLFLGREDREKIAGVTQVTLMERQKLDMKEYLLTLGARIELMKK